MPISALFDKEKTEGSRLVPEFTLEANLSTDELYAAGLLSIAKEGADGFSPVITVTPIPGNPSGFRITIVDKFNTEFFEFYNGTTIDAINLEECEQDNVPIEGLHVGDFYLDFVLDGGSRHEYVSLVNFKITSDNIIVNESSIQYTLTEVLNQINQYISEKQDILTSENAGDGIAITTDSSGKVIISNTNLSAEWGNIQGNITDQTDLVDYINDQGFIKGGAVKISSHYDGYVNYTPLGTNSSSNVNITPTTTSVNSINSVGTLPSLTFTYQDEGNLVLGWSAGTLPTSSTVNNLWNGYSEAEAEAQEFDGTGVNLQANFLGTNGLRSAGGIEF